MDKAFSTGIDWVLSGFKYSKVLFIRDSLVRNIRLYVFFHIPRRKHHITNTFNYSLIRYSVLRFIRLYVSNQTPFRK